MSVSEEFWAAWPAGGHIVIDCGCGRTHFADAESAGDWNEGELEELREKAKVDPEHYIAHGNHDSISECQIGGIVYVWDCPCGYGERVEQFLDANREEILRYYKSRIDAAAEQLRKEQALLTGSAP